MTHRFAPAAAALTLALLGTAPALACSSAAAARMSGYANAADIQARGCAQVGVDLDGYFHEADVYANGEGSRVAIGGRGHRTRTRVDAVGYDNLIGTMARSGGRIDAGVDGNGNEMALRAQDGGRISVRLHGDNNYARISAD